MNFETLIQNLQVTHDNFLDSAAKAVNTAMTIRNWLYGYYIVEYEQNGEDRAGYGDRLIRSIEKHLKDKGQKGMSFTNLNIYRQFYFAYPQIATAFPHFLKNLSIIQAVPEQFPVTVDDTIRQAVSDELKSINIKAIQISGQANGAEYKPGLLPPYPEMPRTG
jgi:hypothetical protein